MRTTGAQGAGGGARAKAEIAGRGLVVTVVQGYYGLIAAQRKYANAQVRHGSATLSGLSQKLENGRRGCAR